MADLTFDQPLKVEFIRSRWHMTIRITGATGEVYEFVACADQGVSYGDQLWFGTAVEHDEAEARA